MVMGRINMNLSFYNARRPTKDFIQVWRCFLALILLLGPCSGNGDVRAPLVYYGPWDQSKIREAWQRDPVIVHPGPLGSNLDRNTVLAIRRGADGKLSTPDDLRVLAYLSEGGAEFLRRGVPRLEPGFEGPGVWDGEAVRMTGRGSRATPSIR